MAIFKNNKVTYLQLLALHGLMAFSVYLFEPISKLLMLAVVVYFFIRVFANNNRKDEVLLAAAYITGFEVFSRMTGGTITYEFAKYAVILFLIIGMFFRGFNKRSWPYTIYILLLIPGIFFSAVNLDYQSSVADAVGFNLSGPVSLGICAMYCYGAKMTMDRLQGILLACLLPIIMTMVYLFLYTPDLRDVITNTASSAAASGGFGPNQVATILGLGAFILFTRLFTIRNKFINIIDISLLALVVYRAIATFSRGGVVTAAVCTAIFLLTFFLSSSARQKAILLPRMAIVMGVLLVTWLGISLSTSGLIDKRYANQDAAGREKEDLSTGRLDLLNEELNAFYENPITGIGVGKAKEYRLQKTGDYLASHNEMSRVLSEHGSFGILALLILIITPMLYRVRNRTNVFIFAFVAFWFFTINHSSMRIAAPSFIYGLALITLVSEKKKRIIYRK